MTSELSSLLLHGWENLWKNKVLWVFSFFVLIDPLLRLIIPIPKNENLPVALLLLMLSLAAIYFTFMSYAGISVVAYSIAIGKTVDFRTAFQNATNIFWRVVGITLFLFILISPCLLASAIFSYNEPFRIADLARSFFLLSIPLSLFMAMWFFPITESVANDSKIGTSLKAAWTTFTHHFIGLAIIGLILITLFYTTNVFISMSTLLIQNHFDFSVLSKFNFISPQLSVASNPVYRLASTFAQAVWVTFSTSIFTFAYLKYSDAKMSQQRKS